MTRALRWVRVMRSASLVRYEAYDDARGDKELAAVAWRAGQRWFVNRYRGKGAERARSLAYAKELAAAD